MKLDLSDIFAGKQKEISFDYPLTIEDEFYDVTFPEPLYINGTVKNMAGYISLRMVGKINYDTFCDRCSKPIKSNMELVIERTVAQAKTVANDEVDESYLVVEGSSVELDETVREEFVLSFPTKHLCSEECLGLCPVCGKDLNTEKCSCNDKTVDPKWGDILKMFEE
jgi:uncharacterized protein